MERKKTFKGNKGKYLLELASNPSRTIGEICSEIGISQSSYFYWLETDKDFAKKVRDIRDVKIDVVDQIFANYAENMANRYVELANQNDDKRTALEALEKINKYLSRGEENGKPQISKIEFQWED